jgi:hypothetical protein
MCRSVVIASAVIPAGKRGPLVAERPNMNRQPCATAASIGRRLTGEELKARARDLGAVVSGPRKVSHSSEIAAVGQQPRPKTSRHRQLPAWLKIRMRAQRRLFDIDRPERAAAYAPGTGLTIEAAEGDRP